MTKKITRLIAVALLLATLLTAGGCGINVELMSNSEADDIVATVGDVEIPYENYYFLAMNQIADMKAVYGENVFDDPEKVQELKDFVAENLFGYTEAMILVGREYGLELDSDEAESRVQDEIDKMMENQFENDRDAYIEMLNTRYMTDHYFRTYIGVTEYLIDEILLQMSMRGESDHSESEIRKTVKDKDAFAHIYQVHIDPQYLLGNEEMAKSKAESLREKVLAAAPGDARMKAMREAIQHSHAVDGGDGLYVAKGELQERFDEVAFSLDEDGYGVSEVMYLDGGYCFLMRAPKDDAYIDAHLNELEQKIDYVSINRKAERYLTELTLEWTELGAELDILDLPELEADGGEWVKTLIALLILAGIVGLIAALVVLIPNKDKKKKKKKKKEGGSAKKSK